MKDSGVPCCILALNFVKQLNSTLLLLILFIQVFLSFAREQTDGVGVDGTESFMDFASSSSDDTPQISHSIAKSQFAYMNPGYSGDKGEKVGQLAAVFVNPDDEFTSF